MIALTRLNGLPIVVNAELIEAVEATPDTVVSLIHGKKLVVLESLDEVVERIIHYRQRAALDPRLGEAKLSAMPLSTAPEGGTAAAPSASRREASRREASCHED
jgi:flagellar protein FlbD